jgi:hypothetical protein
MTIQAYAAKEAGAQLQKAPHAPSVFKTLDGAYKRLGRPQTLLPSSKAR